MNDKPYFIQQVDEARRMRKIENVVTMTIKGIGIIAMLYFAIAAISWQARNPKANQITFWTHLPDALTFQKVQSFQE